MTAERWRRVREIFEEAVERDREGRSAFVEARAGGDEALASEVFRLLADEEEAGGFLETPAAGVAPDSLSEAGGFPEGRRVGPYVLKERIGLGGMGSVYRAVRSDEAFQRQVALKIVNRGMNTEFILRRFRSERQILAGLDHPNIARLYDGGSTEDDLPYFAMEYIEGKDLLSWCDARRLPVTERLRLFVVVCSAVAYAHRNLVVHRDLKPGNILVTEGGAPKLLDFGLAKVLNSDVSSRTAEITALTSRLLTPEYASPEQVRGEKITTASDIYSLGVVLYELLTGRRPYALQGEGTAKIGRVVCEEAPERPSLAVARVETGSSSGGSEPVRITPEVVSASRNSNPASLSKRLRGDLDNIVLACLRKEPERRYGSVELLAEDIRRHLDGRPVRARTDTFGYRAGKFVRRNRVAVGAGALVTVSLVAALGISLERTRVARAERSRAEERFRQVRKLAHTFLFDVHDAIADLPGATRARSLLVREGLSYLDSLSREAGDDLTLKAELAAAYLRVAEVQSAVGTANEGDSASALSGYRKAVGLREDLASDDTPGPGERDDLAEAQIRFAGFLGKTGQLAEAIALGRKAVANRQAILASDPENVRVEARLGASEQMLAWSVSEGGAPLEARALLESSARHLVRAAASPQGEPWVRHALGFTYHDLGETWERTGDYRRAIEVYDKARETAQGILATEPVNTRARLRLVFTLGDMAFCRRMLGETSLALAMLERALPLAEDLAGEDVRNAQAKSALGMTKLLFGETLIAAGRPAEAVGHLGAAATIFEAMVGDDPLNAWARMKQGRVYLATGNARFASSARHGRVGDDDRRRACSFFRRSAEVLSRLKSEGRLPEIEKPMLAEAEMRLRACTAAPGKPAI